MVQQQQQQQQQHHQSTTATKKATDNHNNSDEKQQQTALTTLDKKRQTLEIEAEAIILELKSETHGNVGMDQPLVDAEGYPRGDVDVYRIRALRSRWNQIQTDHKEIMKQMETRLTTTSTTTTMPLVKTTPQEEALELQARKNPKPKPKFDPKSGKWVVMNWDGSVAGVKGGDQRSFANLEKKEEEKTVDNNMDTSTDDYDKKLIAFAKINFVAPNSPAAQACLEKGDLVLRFGSIDYQNHHDLKAIGALVPRLAESNQSVEVQVYRQSSKLLLKLSPQSWHGRGLLGCHIVKYEE